MEQSAGSLHDANIEVYAIGVDVPSGYDFLDWIASSPDTKFIVRDIDHIQDVTYDAMLNTLRGDTFTFFSFYQHTWEKQNHLNDNHIC